MKMRLMINRLVARFIRIPGGKGTVRLLDGLRDLDKWALKMARGAEDEETASFHRGYCEAVGAIMFCVFGRQVVWNHLAETAFAAPVVKLYEDDEDESQMARDDDADTTE